MPPGMRLRIGDVEIEITKACDPCRTLARLPYVGPEKLPAFLQTMMGRRGVNWTALYELADQSSIQVAFTSGEAERARQDWERWLPHVTDLSVEVYAALSPIPGYEHWN